MKSSSLILILLITLIFQSSNYAITPDGILLHQNPQGYGVHFTLPQYTFETIRAEGSDFTRIRVSDYGITNDIGYPALPQISFFLAIPAGQEVPRIVINSKQNTDITIKNKIFPFQMPWEKNRPLSDRPFSMNRAFYNSDGAQNQPHVTVSDPFVIAGVKGVRVTIYPFAYNPRLDKVTVTGELDFQIYITEPADNYNFHSEFYNQYLNDIFVNYTRYTSKSMMNYLIITAPEFESGLSGFVAHKAASGYNVSVVTTTVAGTTTTAIKNFITQRYNDPLQRPEFFLLVGDVEKIPYWVGTGSSTPSNDLTYVLLQGNDYFADASIGRFSVTTPAELANIINKTIYMEQYIATLQKKNVFMASTDNWSITEGTHNAVIDTFFVPNNYTHLKLYTHTYNATTEQLRQALNQNQQFAIYSGHGSTTGWADGPVFGQSDVRGLTNSVIFPFTYSFACITGSYQLTECFGETWIRQAKAASAFYGSSVNSYWDEDDILERRLIKALFTDNLAKITPMMDKAKIYFVQHYGSLTADVKRYMEMYNLMGDPSLTTKKVIPPDNTPPMPITDLTAPDATTNSVSLRWTAPYDSTFGGITAYDIRYSTSPLDSLNFNNAPYRFFAGQSDTAGTVKNYTIDSLQANTLYYIAVKAKDVWGNTSKISNGANKKTWVSPVLAVTPDSIKRTLQPQMVVLDSVIIRNGSTSPSTMNYSIELANNTFPGTVDVSIVPVTDAATAEQSDKNETQSLRGGQSVEGQGGPDQFGYKWIDSDEPNGPQFIWNDISTTGTAVTSWVATGTFDPKDEGYAGPFPLGFNFKFYGQPQTQIYVSTDGVLLFSVPTGNIFTNGQIPLATDVNGIIAPFWDDLDGRTQGTVHYKQDGGRFIVQFTNWQRYSGTGSLTFQIVLYSGGKIMYYYKDMNATLNAATVGIENLTGSTGLQIAYNANYVKNNLAVKIAAEPDWVGTAAQGGTLYNGNQAAVKLTFRSEDFPAGNYGIDLKISSNDPANPLKTVPVRMSLVNPLQPVTVTSPNGGENWSSGTTKNITWNQTGLTSVAIKYTTNNGGTWLPVAASLPAATGSYAWLVPSTPSQQCKVRISNAAADTVFDISDNAFTISSTVPMITWQGMVNVKDNTTAGAAQNLNFGFAPTASNGIDLNLGEISLPPSPPAGIFDARFELPVTPAEFSVKDYRRDTLQSAVWTIKFQPGTGGYPFTFTWDPSALPQGSFTLKDAVTGTLVNVDMKAVNTYSLTNTGITQLKIEYTKQMAMAMNLSSGWNMVSMPFVAGNMNATSLFPQATSAVFSYNNGYTPQTILTTGLGYWVRYANAAQHMMSGNPAPANTIALTAGWNLIGAFYNDVPVAGITTNPANIINSSFFGFNGGYMQATALNPCKAYWVRTTQAGTMNLPASLAKDGMHEPQLIHAEWNSITVGDAAGNSAVLYSPYTSVDLGIYQLPPLPPQGIFDTRFGDGSFVHPISGKGSTIQISGAAYPVSLTANGMDIRIRDIATSGKIINRVIKSGERMEIENSGITAVEVSAIEVPLTFELRQNYPNPFNPSTTISFGLPENANISLRVFNQLGEQVALLAGGDFQAGYHEVIWNAANLTSGVYFYELKTGKFSSIRKLILMK